MTDTRPQPVRMPMAKLGQDGNVEPASLAARLEELATRLEGADRGMLREAAKVLREHRAP